MQVSDRSLVSVVLPTSLTLPTVSHSQRAYLTEAEIRETLERHTLVASNGLNTIPRMARSEAVLAHSVFVIMMANGVCPAIGSVTTTRAPS